MRLHCAHCKHTFTFTDSALYREFGDFVIDCPSCLAHNVIVPIADEADSQPTPLLAITRYHAAF